MVLIDMTEFYSILWTCVGTIVTGLTSWGLTLLIKWLSSKIKNEKLASYMSQVGTIITNAVLYTEQTFVKTLKEENKWDSESYKKALNTALENAQSQLTENLSNWIKANYGDVKTYLTTLIEAQIASSKTSK